MIIPELCEARYLKYSNRAGYKFYIPVIVFPGGRMRRCKGVRACRTATKALEYAESIIKRLKSLQAEVH